MSPDRPLTTVFTDRFGSSMVGPFEGVPIVVSKVTELSFVSGSVSLAVTLAVFDNCPADCGCTTMFTIANEPLGKLPRLQVTVLLPLHDPWVGVADTNVIPDGRLSVTTTFVAGDGPLFVTVRR